VRCIGHKGPTHNPPDCVPTSAPPPPLREAAFHGVCHKGPYAKHLSVRLMHVACSKKKEVLETPEPLRPVSVIRNFGLRETKR
jgi:hypothetical protein